jgi:XTP/dITP diphosphohydrolase
VGAVRKLVLASGNQGKLRELGVLLEPLNWLLVSQNELGVSEAEEPFNTFVENALAKARHAARSTGLAAIADDSGLCVPALCSAPGVRSARFAASVGRADRIAALGTDSANNEALIEQLSALPVQGMWNFPAYFACVLVLVRHCDDPEPVVAQGRWWGTIQSQACGEYGFGYDPHFYVPEHGKTAAQLSSVEKNRVSHRGQAMQQLLLALRASS